MLIQPAITDLPEITAAPCAPVRKGVLRYDSQVHDAATVARMTPHAQQLIARLQRHMLPGSAARIVQTQPWPGDTAADLLALRMAQATERGDDVTARRQAVIRNNHDLALEGLQAPQALLDLQDLWVAGKLDDDGFRGDLVALIQSRFPDWHPSPDSVLAPYANKP